MRKRISIQSRLERGKHLLGKIQLSAYSASISGGFPVSEDPILMVVEPPFITIAPFFAAGCPVVGAGCAETAGCITAAGGAGLEVVGCTAGGGVGFTGAA